MGKVTVGLSTFLILMAFVPSGLSVNFQSQSMNVQALCQVYAGDLGVEFAGQGGQVGGGGMPGLAGTVQVPQKFVLLGIPKATPLGAYDSNNDNMLTVDDLQVNEPVRFVGQADGNVKITIPRLNREHILLSPANGGWWPMLAEGLGFKPDGLRVVGQPFVAVCGVVVDPKKLIALGFQEVMEGARLELYDYIEEVWRAQPLLADLAGVRGQESELAAIKDVFLGKITIGAGDVALRDMPNRGAESGKFVAALRDRGISVVLPKIPGFVDRSGSLIGMVAEADKLRAQGLVGARVGDHVHLIPQGQDWKVRLCLPRGKTTLLRVSEHGAVERVELKQK